MNVKTVEGLIGANTNVDLINTPLRVFQDAERKGDTAAMDRAMGYVNECQDKVKEYKAKADEGMKEDAKEAKTENNKDTDMVEISEDSKAAAKQEGDSEPVEPDSKDSATAADAAAAEPITYTKAGDISQPQPESGANISVSV